MEKFVQGSVPIETAKNLAAKFVDLIFKTETKDEVSQEDIAKMCCEGIAACMLTEEILIMEAKKYGVTIEAKNIYIAEEKKRNDNLN